MEGFNDFLNEIQRELKERNKEVIVAGDFNAKSCMWKSVVEDERGRILMEWAIQNNLIVLNEGTKPTFQRGSSASHIDITFATRETVRKIKKWKVEDEESHSLHNYISFQMEERKSGRRGGEEWEYTRPSKDRIIQLIREHEFMLSDAADTGRCIKALQEINKKACWKKKAGGLHSVYFWTEELGRMKKDIDQKRRKIMRARSKGEGGKEYFKVWCEELAILKKEFKKEIRKQKRRSWQVLLSDGRVDN